ncbi:NAD(P)/FAD-dependent oxidoreductase [methanotrophic endosymbiont of Bathymodiolus puteoserpentis (Logatchev)]|jgi:flavin-dependent dehydrogenase|uniref:NAD(P)/FAD-dependent oxidoreductase n=1 Tax=methanotrophic endosymbiont of Bathymodiolus puteoserpentis (Logatchev) TaxID=343235 RepID=UPI0013C54C35|nr:NAD(P)/FAD-dependent oxidoreductase [methanotrophic endosymbiont of Bathymodiolus puteoserpentis (Logatchev)]SHE19832.1 FIG022199: FAD-binding protein [methanotrophic endosymbiont of Bathymodiolus puteoserpentis (Logatchev)]
MQQIIPKKCTVLVIGGGPAGSSTATHLAKSGVDVVLLERAEFPRNQVGESLIPHFWKFTDQLGVSEKIQQQGFLRKAGGITVWNDKVHQILFSDYGYTRPGLHVERDIFDNLLLEHSKRQGALVFNNVVVKQVDLSAVEPIISYIDTREESNVAGTIQCQFVVDASGHSSLLAHQLGTRQSISSEMNFLSLWGYFKGSRYVGVDRQSHASSELKNISPVTFVMSHKDGWLWHIVLREKTSVGLIVRSNKMRGLDKQQREIYFQQSCARLPHLKELLSDAQFMDGSLQYRPDYSYYATQTCKQNYYCIGDAAGFVDPVFSHGVQNAFYNAAVASLAIREALKNTNKSARYAQLCESRMQQFYGFSRALSLGDFGINGVNRDSVKSLMKAMPPLELELMLVASEMTNRSENFKQLAHEAGVWESFSEQHEQQKRGIIDDLKL